MFAQALTELFSESVFTVVRVIASIGGGFVGWFVSDPLTRLIYRVIARSKTPGWLLSWAKLAGAATLALLIWFFLPLGGGGGGLGWGPGPGGRPGKGPGKGGELAKGSTQDRKPDNEDKKLSAQKETVEFEVLGGKRVQDEGNNRYFLLKSTGRAMNLEEMDDYLQKNASRVLVIKLTYTDDSFVSNAEDSPRRQLEKLASKYGVAIRESQQK